MMAPQMVLEAEIRAARVERLEPVRRGTQDPKRSEGGTQKKAKPRILQDYFETYFDGTRQRKKDDMQRCSTCGAPSVWKGRSTGHTLAHSRWGGNQD